MKRISDLMLGQIDMQLTDRDRRLVVAIRDFRFMKTNQVQRLYFPALIKTPRAALTATTRTMNRLRRLGLIDHLEKRIGGVRGGSQGLIWFVTEAGHRLLQMGTPLEGKRKRTLEPSPLFLRHILAVTECCIQITEICRSEKEMDLIRIVIEPECWRSYEHGGKSISLRPDLYAETTSGEYRDYWFVEMDLATESMNDILEKCKRYHEYRQTEMEQKANEVFPVVLFIVPDEIRKQKIKEAIRETFKGRLTKIFLVITPQELHRTMRDGAEAGDLC